MICLSRKDKWIENGQASLVFVASLLIIVAALALLVDGGRYLVMRNRARMMADASTLAGASMLDIEESQKGNFCLGAVSAQDKVEETFYDNKGKSPDWADFQLTDVQIQGNVIWVTVVGKSAPLFVSNLGLNYSATVVSSARAASGISGER